MTALSIQPTFPTFTDSDGTALENGFIWIGVAGSEPISTPLTAYWDAALTQVVTQPVRTRGGYPLNGSAIGRLYVNSNYSIKVRNRNGFDLYSSLTATERYSEVVVNTNASQVVYDPAGTGAVATTVQAKLRESVSVLDFGADPTGVVDSTAAINNAILSADVVLIPEGLYRCDSTIQIYDDFKTVLLQGTLKRLAANSASTRPVVRIKGNYCSFQGVGPASTVWSENTAPTGVFLWGSENPGDAGGSDIVNSRHVNVSKLRIRSKDASANGFTLALLSSQSYSSGALYDGIFSDILLVGGTYQLYLNPNVNGNIFNNIVFYETRNYGLYLDGGAGPISITDNVFSNFFSDAAVSNIYSYFGTRVGQCCFSNMGGEPGFGAYVNFDATCGSLVWTGYDNHPSGGSWLATDSFYSVNGSTRVANIISNATATLPTTVLEKVTIGTSATWPTTGFFHRAADSKLHVVAGSSGINFDAPSGAATLATLTATSFDLTQLFFPLKSSGAPAYVKGAIYFDTALNKLRVGGATTWETITSV